MLCVVEWLNVFVTKQNFSVIDSIDKLANCRNKVRRSQLPNCQIV